MTPKTRKGMLLTGSLLCLVLGFVAGRLRPQAEADTGPDLLPAELIAEPAPLDLGPREPLIVPLHPDIQQIRLDVQHDDVTAGPVLPAVHEEPQTPFYLLDPPGGGAGAASGDSGLSPLCPRANLLQPVPLYPAVTSETTVVRRPPSLATVPADPAKSARSQRGDGLPFTGSYPVTLPPERNRLTLPSQVCAQLDEGPSVLYLRSDADGCIWIGTAAGLERLAGAADRTSPARRRLFFAQTERCRVTADGQLIIPESLWRLASLTSDGVLIGAGDHFELWEAARWRQYLQDQTGILPLRSTADTHSDKSRYYRVTNTNQKFIDIAKQTLGDPTRWEEIYRLNPTYNPAYPLPLNSILLVPPEDLPESKEPEPLED